MTDRELIELLQEKSAGELTSAEVDAIRARWTQSPDLRHALLEHLHLESQLLGALSPIELDVDAILQRASEQHRTRHRTSPRRWWIIGLGLLLVVGVGTFAVFGPVNGPKPDRQPLAGTERTTPERPDETGQNESASVVQNEDPVGTPNSPDNMDPPSGTGPEKTAPVIPETKPIPKSVVADVAANEPWSASLARDIAPWAANSPRLVADYKAAGHDELPESEAKRWLAQVEGEPYNWATDAIGNPVRRIARFHGLAKLRAPWPDDAVLRVTPFEVTDLTLYFWRGPVGVAFRFTTRREPHLWAAFEIARENSSPRPTRFSLLTTDSGAYTRSTPGTFDIRMQDGDLVLARGGLILMSVPFAGAPIEVFLEGQLRLRGLSMHRSAPFRRQPESSHPVVIAGPAAVMAWSLSVESPATLVSNEDGSVSMTVDSPDKSGLIGIPFGWQLAMQQSVRATGLFEAIVKVESADPGTGIFLGDRDGRPLQKLGFYRDVQSQRVAFGILRPGEYRLDANYNPNDFPAPFLAKPGWFKLVAGLGTLHILASGDGIHWGHVFESPGRDLPGPVGSIGLYGLHGPTARTIRVSRIAIRELDGVTGLADASLRSLVQPFTVEQLRDATAWNHRVLDSCPVGIEPTDWFTSSAVAALCQGPAKDFGLALLRQLVAVGIRSDLPIEKKLKLLDDASSLCDLFDDNSAKSIAVFYEELGWQLAADGDPQPLDRIRPAWLWSPIWTLSKMRYVWERMHSHEILLAVYRRDWPAAWALSQSAMYWNLLPHPDQRPTERGEELDRHARWAKAVVGEVAPNLDDGTAGVMPTVSRHPLIPALNKEAYNVRAELQSALSGQNFEDACRIVMSIAEHDGTGLLPDVDDRQLYVSLPTAVANARRAYPGFAATMTGKFEPLGQIRVRTALNRRDLAGLRAATLQFVGTDAARDAHASLGDLALSIGQFEAAEQHFCDALIDVSDRQRQSLEAKLLLSRALAGRLPASQKSIAAIHSPTHPIELNGTTVSPPDFQSVIEDLTARPASSSLIAETARTSAVSSTEAGSKLESRAQFDGQPGNNPGRWEYRFGDPFGRQLSVTSDDRRIYVSNRFQVNAYQLPDGAQVWAQSLGSEQGEAYALPFTPMKPLLAGDRLYVRRLTKAGVELACLKVDDGQVIWHQRQTLGILSDPTIWNGRLFALTLTRIDDDLVQVEAAWFDPLTGNVTSSRPLFRLRDVPDRQFSGQLSVDDRIAICTVAGTTACIDLRGDVNWIRRHTLLQRPVDELAEDFRMAPPSIRDGRVIVTLPGVREVCCLDLKSGRTLWDRAMPGLKGIVHTTDSEVVVETVSGLTSLDSDSGNVVWQRPIDTRLEATVVDGRTLLTTRRVTFPNNRSKPIVTRLDLDTGRELYSALLDVQDREEFQLGPMFAAGGKWWTFVGQGWKETKRELHEF